MISYSVHLDEQDPGIALGPTWNQLVYIMQQHTKMKTLCSNFSEFLHEICRAIVVNHSEIRK